MSRKRYYLHGDRNREGVYFCRRCDAFAPAAHFADGSHGMTEVDHLRLLASSAAGWFGADTQLTRPSWAKNALFGSCYRRLSAKRGA